MRAQRRGKSRKGLFVWLRLKQLHLSFLKYIYAKNNLFLKDTSHLIICSFLSFRYHRKCRSRAIKAADNPPATGNVTNHASTIFLKSFQSTPCRDLNQPTNTIDPTLQWVVDMGIPMLEAKRTVNADPTSIQKPLKFRKQYQIRFEVKLWLCFHVNIGVNIVYHALKNLMFN